MKKGPHTGANAWVGSRTPPAPSGDHHEREDPGENEEEWKCWLDLDRKCCTTCQIKRRLMRGLGRITSPTARSFRVKADLVLFADG